MGPSRVRRNTTGLPPLRWVDICARREEPGRAWTAVCPLCRTPLAAGDDDLRWLAENGRLVSLPDGCGAHRYCAIEKPNRDPALIAGHDHVPLDGTERRREERRGA